jgi:hypothetical protein
MKINFTAGAPSGSFISTQRVISRRSFLRGTGVALALPLLDSMSSVFAAAPAKVDGTPRRMFAVCNNLGLLPDQFFPTGAGRDYAPSPLLELLGAHRNDLTVFSGVSHPYVDGSHASEACFLTAAPHPGSSSFRNSISLDQYIAEQIGVRTRFPSITLGVNTRRGLAWTGTGVSIPCEDKAAEVFKQLFFQGTAEEVAAQVRKLDTGRSILDTVGGQLKRLQAQVGAGDRDRLEQYATSVRDLESRMLASRGWETKPKPVVKAAVPVDPGSPAAYMEKVKVMYDLARLALETDSTRTITLMLDSAATPVVNLADANITEGYHNLSHHGKSENKRAQLKALDEAHMKLLAGLLTDLRAVQEDGDTLLDRTMVLYGSNLGDANTHATTNMPALLAGGGFRHGQHLAFDKTKNYPLPNLYVSMLQRLGIEADKFATSTGTMRGLELA